MIKNAIIFKMRCDLGAEQIEQAIAQQAFVPCQPSQIKSQGWVPPRGENEGSLIEQVDGHIILTHQVESKSIPASATQKRVNEIVAHIEQTTGRKPGKGERKEIKEQAFFELLPRAFTRISKTIVWLDVRNGFLVLGASSQSKADDIATLLAKALDWLNLSLLHTRVSPAAAMTHWLGTGEAPDGFSIDRECELKSLDEMKSVVRYTRHTLDIDEVRQHIGDGKVVTRMATTWVDRVSFVLTDALQLKKIAFHDVTFSDAGESGFDTDVAIMTGELSAMIPDLIEVLGGEVEA